MMNGIEEWHRSMVDDFLIFVVVMCYNEARWVGQLDDVVIGARHPAILSPVNASQSVVPSMEASAAVSPLSLSHCHWMPSNCGWRNCRQVG